MTIKEHVHGKVVTISLCGSLLGEPATSDLRQTVYRLLGENKRKFVLDLGELKFINSMGLGAFIASLISVRTRGGDICLARIRDKVEAVIMVTKLFKAFRLYETVQRAIGSYNK